MKREFLKDLGLEDEVINKIMAENGKEVTTLKAKIDDLNEQVQVKDTTIKQKNDKISEQFLRQNYHCFPITISNSVYWRIPVFFPVIHS